MRERSSSRREQLLQATGGVRASASAVKMEQRLKDALGHIVNRGILGAC